HTLNAITTIIYINTKTTPDINTLSLHDALPICLQIGLHAEPARVHRAHHEVGHHTPLPHAREQHAGIGGLESSGGAEPAPEVARSEEHTSELQSRGHLVCRLLLQKKKNDHQVDI